ncbi:MAG TPA: PP2C family serine/threonine-protein phosphatase, partial [Lacipirellulaceae bacterium]|nr:PP2C family serine/threonine-protein phosphatase [Lacipirellulaceae bacterium]
DLGMRRTNNQDAIAVVVADDVATWATRGHLMIVADGMGAHAAGELASKLAVDNIPHTYFKLRDLYPPAALRQAIRDANATIHAKGQSSIGFQGMGTTCSCLVLLPQGALVAHIGDSRVYRLRGDVLEQLTFDHSLVWEMAAAGQMTEADVPSYIPKNVITRSLGPHPSVHIDLEGPYSAETGDTFLICSDGLSGPVTDEEMGIILRCVAPDEAAETLVDLANFRGGPDNISVIIAQVNGAIPKTPAIEEAGKSAQTHRWPTAPLWLAAGAFLAIFGYCAAHDFWPAAVGSAVGFLAAVAAGLMMRTPPNATSCPPIHSIGGPYGNGPYRKAQCTPNRHVVATLAEIAGKLREQSCKNHGNRALDWKAFEDSLNEAAASAEKEDHAIAVRKYSAAIRTIMKQCRQQGRTTEADTDGF